MQNKAKFHNIMELISNVMEAYTTALFISDEKGVLLELLCYQSFCKDIKKNCQIKSGEGLIGWVLREQKSILAKNFDRSTTTLGLYKEDENIKSLIAVQLPQKKGVLFVDSKRSYTFTEEKEKIFKQFAKLIFSLMVEQQDINKNKVIKNALKGYFEVNQLIDKGSCLKEIVGKIVDIHRLSYFVFIIPGKLISICFFDEKSCKKVYEKIDMQHYSSEGLLGWCIKERKKIVKNRSIDPQRAFILNKNEQVTFNNFVAIPTYEKNNQVVGAIGFSKIYKNCELTPAREEYWHSFEIDMLDKIGSKMFKKVNFEALI